MTLFIIPQFFKKKTFRVCLKSHRLRPPIVNFTKRGTKRNDKESKRCLTCESAKATPRYLPIMKYKTTARLFPIFWFLTHMSFEKKPFLFIFTFQICKKKTFFWCRRTRSIRFLSAVHSHQPTALIPDPAN